MGKLINSPEGTIPVIPMAVAQKTPVILAPAVLSSHNQFYSAHLASKAFRAMRDDFLTKIFDVQALCRETTEANIRRLLVKLEEAVTPRMLDEAGYDSKGMAALATSMLGKKPSGDEFNSAMATIEWAARRELAAVVLHNLAFMPGVIIPENMDALYQSTAPPANFHELRAAVNAYCANARK